MRGASLSAGWKDIARKSMAYSEQLKRDHATALLKYLQCPPEVTSVMRDRPRQVTGLPGGGSVARAR